MDTEILGAAAGTLTTLAFLPQVITTWRTRRVDQISVLLPLMMVCGIALWIAYGILLGSAPLIVANSVALALNAALLAMRIAFRGRGGGR